MPDRRPSRLRAAAIVVALAAGASAGAALPAGASEGSVPAEVVGYVEDGGLVERLNDVYGLDASGTRGIDFDDSTEPGPISRVFRWSEARLAGAETDRPVTLANEWVVPISVGEEPVGFATVWINPTTVLPELAEFVADPEVALALSAVPDAAALVRDDAADAWFALEEGVVTPLAPGRSGLATPAPLDAVAVVPPDVVVEPAADPSTGTVLATAVAGVLLLVTVAALLLPRRGRPEPSAPLESAERNDDG